MQVQPTDNSPPPRLFFSEVTFDQSLKVFIVNLLHVRNIQKRGQTGEVMDRVQHPDSLVDKAVCESYGVDPGPQYFLPEGRRLKWECDGVGGVTSNADSSAGEVGVEDVCEGGQSGTNDLPGCIHCVLQSLPAGGSAASVPHSDAASDDTLSGASVERAHDGGWDSGSPQFAEDVQGYLSLLG